MWPSADGIYDFCRDREERESSRRVFDGVWGAIYDRGVKDRRFSSLISPLWQGASRGVMQDMYAAMDDGISVGPGQVVLDVPCGGGPLLANAKGRLSGDYVGVDLSPRQLKRAARFAARSGRDARTTFVRADARELPIESSSVHQACSFNGLHLIAERVEVLREVRRCLIPGASLIGSTLVVSSKRAPRALHPWFFCLGLGVPQTREEFEADLRAAGFTDFGTTANGPMVVFRAVAPVDATAADTSGVVR